MACSAAASSAAVCRHALVPDAWIVVRFGPALQARVAKELVEALGLSEEHGMVEVAAVDATSPLTDDTDDVPARAVELQQRATAVGRARHRAVMVDGTQHRGGPKKRR